jgi:ATP-dependent Clp protease ATP-binding subunit ClpC
VRPSTPPRPLPLKPQSSTPNRSVIPTEAKRSGGTCCSSSAVSNLVTYTAEALEFAAQSSGSYLPERSLPAKAIELLDAAGSLVRLRQAAPPDEVAEAEKRLKFITHRLESAIANHEFEKARHYSDEERKERENLDVLRVKHHLSAPSAAVVGRDDIKQVISRWSAYPYCP